MIKILRAIPVLSVLLLTCMVVSCSDYDNWDGFHPTYASVYIVIQNESGDNLLDYNHADNVVGRLSGEVSYEGRTYNLDWSIMNEEMFGIFPVDLDAVMGGGYAEDISHWTWKYEPQNIFPPTAFGTGFRYYVIPVKNNFPISDFPADYFLYFGDMEYNLPRRKKIHLSFPEIGQECNIERTEGGTVIVDGVKQEGNTVYITLPSAEK